MCSGGLTAYSGDYSSPLESKHEVEPVEFQLPPKFRDTREASFQAFTAPSPSSFLVEFDLPATGVNRHERIRLEEQGRSQGLAASRRARVKEQHRNFESFLSDEVQLNYVLRHEFFTLMNGVSIDLQDVPPNRLPKIVEEIRSMPGIVNVSPLTFSTILSTPQQTTLNRPKAIVHNTGFAAMGAIPQFSTAHEQTGVLRARRDLNLSGNGIKIGIIGNDSRSSSFMPPFVHYPDRKKLTYLLCLRRGVVYTGVDYTHEALGSCYGIGCKVQFGYDFVDLQESDAPGGYD
ncbi:MAG: hypothetical protein J3Q66DRAFT_372211 [Benniella sp.]|nr:MAG: hypothetical protein J3Q66DRAFT_372211 [Benniella sp.]